MSVVQKDIRNHADTDIKLVLEIHATLVTREMLNYSIRDLLPKGKLYSNPSLIKGNSNQINGIQNGHYNVLPYVKNFFNGRKHLPGYVYLVDTDQGMMTVHEEPVPDPDPKNKLGTRTSRFLTS